MTFTVAIVGRPNVGKSTLINRLVGEERLIAFDQPGTTRDSIFVPFERDGQAYTLIDTAGVRRRARVSEMIEKFRIVKPLQAIDRAQVVIDVLDAPEVGGGGRQTLDIVRAYWRRADADPQALLDLATRLGRGSVFKRLGFTAERFGNPGTKWLDRCRDRLSAGVALLDPAGPKRGPIISRWRLRINLPLDDAA